MDHCSNEERLSFFIKKYEKLFNKLQKLNNDKFMFLTKFDVDKFENFKSNTLLIESEKIDKNILLVEDEMRMYSYEISKLRYCVKTNTPWHWYL